MYKKAASGEFILWVARVLITLFVIGIIVAALNSSIKKNLELEELRFYPVAERLLYSPDCFVVKHNSRPMPGIIIPEKFTNASIDSCMKPILQDDSIISEGLTGVKPSIGAKITLYYNQKESAAFYNKEFYDDILPLTFSNQYMIAKKRFFVLVEDKETLIPGNLLIEVAWRK